jgi:two-component system, LytTR family, sensor kinase
MHSISALMLINVSAADKMMTRLSDLLRMSLESSGIQITSLRRELEFVSGCLEIEKVRFAERLEITLEIAPDTLDAEVPSLLLQPLAENAIRHGISRLSSGGHVWITASRVGNDLCLRVKDNGPGLVKYADSSHGTGFGLRATRERLRTLYGKTQRFEVDGGSDGGVDVSVTFPFRTGIQLSSDEVVLESLDGPSEISETEAARGFASPPALNVSKDLL